MHIGSLTMFSSKKYQMVQHGVIKCKTSVLQKTSMLFTYVNRNFRCRKYLKVHHLLCFCWILFGISIFSVLYSDLSLNFPSDWSVYSVFKATIKRIQTFQSLFSFNPSTASYSSSLLTNEKNGFQGLQGSSNNECIIPLTPVMPYYFRNLWKLNPPQLDCTYEQNLAELKDDETMNLNQNFAYSNCCVQEIIKADLSDSSFNLTECTPFTSSKMNMDEAEVVAIKCDPYYINFDAAIPIKDKVRDKLNLWAEQDFSASKKEKPISILMLGFDSTSRAHAYRSLPKTIEFMKTKLGFIDFEQYHSVAPSTLTNYMAFLMGLTRSEVRSTCAPNWKTPLDDCPLIWQDFNDANYITNYVEDGEGSFNWGGQSGFVDDPTDYYIHRLFVALNEMRILQNQTQKLYKKYKKMSLTCTSRESVPDFLLRYTQRFIQKFQTIPFFAFTWFAYPFHEDLFSLATMDNALLQFFESLQNLPGFLRRTMIIFVSDHGDRMSFFSSESPESYIERGLPPLLIRLPERLTEKYPEMQQALRYNSHKLTTPFDIHSTLLHLLSIEFPQSEKYKSFSPQTKDRSSLLLKVPANRTCESTNVPSASCLCNVHYDEEESNRKKLIIQTKSVAAKKLLAFVTSQLNLKVQASKYRQVCETWKTVAKDILYARKITMTNTYLEILLAFVANPGEAKFESRVRLNMKSRDFGKVQVKEKDMQLIGFSRINRYGDQSWCVDSATDFDKAIKELCMCKVQLALASTTTTRGVNLASRTK